MHLSFLFIFAATKQPEGIRYKNRTCLEITTKEQIMGFLDNLFNDDKKSGSGSNNNNPLANIRKNIEQLGKKSGGGGMKGPGQSLGGRKHGDVIQVIITEPGPLGVKVERKTNNSKSAIVNMVVEGSQAEAAGLQRGDVLCFAGSDGQEEMPYSMFLEIAKSKQRPIREYL